MADDRPRLGGRPSLDGEALVVLGLVWGDDGCRVRLRVPDPGPDGTIEPSQLVPVVGLELNYRVGPDARRHCLGHSSPQRNNGAYVDCHNRPQPNEKTCVSCAVADAEFASNLHHAHTRQRDALDRSVVDHLEQTNELYVAAFRDGSLKIGTSTGHRTAKRLTEQGAWRAVRVASVTDGFTVRLLEDLVTEKLGLTQSVAVKRKLQGMTNPLGDRLLDERLDPMVQEVHRLIGSLDRLPGSAEPDGPEAQPDVGDPPHGIEDPPEGVPHPPEGIEDPPEGIEDKVELIDAWWAFPESDSPVWDRLRPYPARLDTGTHHVEILAICGRMAVLRRPAAVGNGATDDRFVADLAQLFGVELDIGHYQPDRLAVQDSLF